MTDWNALYACDQCDAQMGAACFALRAEGPEALPPVLADRPHSGRKRKDAEPVTTRPRAAATAARNPTARRAAAGNEALIKAWRAKGAGRRG